MSSTDECFYFLPTSEIITKNLDKVNSESYKLFFLIAIGKEGRKH